MIGRPRKIELLAPAANASIAKEAVLHGADAVYIGPPSHGARKGASNSIEDILSAIEFAHQYGAKVYATVNTIVFENELKDVERLVWDLYRIGTDALIVQDMSLLRLDLPPIALHSSTQCDTRTVEKARFLDDAGFSQIVLARELTLNEISEISRSVNVPVEVFIHGALCVSYSGRCHASQAVCGRSANRGECAQICRLPYNLIDDNGKTIIKDRHLLSLKDFNASHQLHELLNAGVSSLKIEGRLKEMSYVKNVVAYYRRELDKIIKESNGKFIRSSYGRSEISFTPDLYKSFNRGFTEYFLVNRRNKDITSPLTPKSMGEPIRDINALHNGDGISFFNKYNEYEGVKINKVENGRIIGNKPFVLPKDQIIHRTFDVRWDKLLNKPSAKRKLWLDVELDSNSLKALDEKGNSVIIRLDADIQEAKSPRDIRKDFDKFGNTLYSLRNFKANFNTDIFIPASQLAEARRKLLKALENSSKINYRYDLRRKENKNALYPIAELDYRDNVANSKAREFYFSHGVTKIEKAMETEQRIGDRKKRGVRVVMTTRHCILRENGRCLRETPAAKRDFKLPLSLRSMRNTFLLDFDCSRCEMLLLTDTD